MDEPTCAIPGDDNSPLTKGEFNRLIAQVRYYHMRPLRDDIKDLKHMLSEQDRVMVGHIASDKEFYDKLAGAKWMLWLIAALVAPVVPLTYYTLRALFISGVL